MDFGSLSGKANMKRKQSNSLLAALSKQSTSRQSAIPINANTPPPLTSTSAHFNHPLSSASSEDHSYPSYASDSPYSSYPDHSTSTSTSTSTRSYGHVSGRSASASTTGSIYGVGGGTGSRLSTQHEYGYPMGKGSSGSTVGEEKKGPTVIRRPEDVLKLVKERVAAWSFLMQWYEGDTHWLKTVKVSRAAIESSIGPSKVDQRARNFFILGISLSAVFDLSFAVDFLRGLLKVLDEWESWSEGTGNKGVKNLFRGQKASRKVSGTGMSDFPGGDNTESLIIMNLPFQPDFFQVHMSTCNIIRDLYKKLLGMVLPSRPVTYNQTPWTIPSPTSALLHTSTIIQSAEVGSPFSNPLSPGAMSYPSFDGGGGGLYEDGRGERGADGLDQLIAGVLPSNRTLVGDGQKLTPQLVDMIYKVDARLKKHYSILIREGDALARKVLDDELSNIMFSLTSGAEPIRFDYTAALSSAGLYGTDSGELRDKDFGIV